MASRIRSRLPRRLNAGARELALFAVAIAGVVYETVLAHADRPYLLGLFGAMLGLPYFAGRDRETKQRHGDEDDDE